MAIYVKRNLVLIRTEEQKDSTAVYALNESAFETSAEADLVDALRNKSQSVVSLVADEHKNVVGPDSSSIEKL